MFPGNDGRKTVLRWTSPASGGYKIQGKSQDINETTSDVSIVINGNTAQPLFSDEITDGTYGKKSLWSHERAVSSKTNTHVPEQQALTAQQGQVT